MCCYIDDYVNEMDVKIMKCFLMNNSCIYLKFSWKTLAIRWILIMHIVYPIGPVSIF